MNDRMEIAKTMMAAMRGSSSWAKCASETLAKQAIADADELIAALAESAQAAGEYDAVGDWRKYVREFGKYAVIHVADGDMIYVDGAFTTKDTPQGRDFWEAVADGYASRVEISRAQDFARRVLEQMEADGE